MNHEPHRWPVPGRYAVLNPESPRAALWRSVFGGLVVPVRSLDPVMMNGAEGVLPMLVVDAPALPPEALARATRAHALFEDCAEDLARERILGYPGMPILADDVMIGPDPAACLREFAEGPRSIALIPVATEPEGEARP